MKVFMRTKSPFLQSVESFMRVRNYSERTIDAYLYWCKCFIVFCGKQHPRVDRPLKIRPGCRIGTVLDGF